MLSKVDLDKLWPVVTILVTSMVVLILLGFYIAPELMKQLAVEDGIVENLQVVILFASSIIMATFAFKHARTKGTLLFATSLLIALGLFIVAAEEISWGQRIFMIESPDFFAEHNWQSEINLHNFHSSTSNLLLYIGASILLVIMPIFKKQLTKLIEKSKLKRIVVLLPSEKLVVPFALFTGFVTSNSGSLLAPIVIPFYPLFAILNIYLVYSFVRKKQQVHQLGLVTVTLLTLVVFILVNTLAPVTDWAFVVSEYKELLIYLGTLLYAITLTFNNSAKTLIS